MPKYEFRQGRNESPITIEAAKWTRYMSGENESIEFIRHVEGVTMWMDKERTETTGSRRDDVIAAFGLLPGYAIIELFEDHNITKENETNADEA